MSLSRDQILAADDLPRVSVTVPEWGGDVWVKSMTAAERDAWEQQILSVGDGQRLDNVRARLVALTAVDESGRLLFEPEDIHALGKKSARALDRLFDATMKLNGVSKKDVDAIAGES